ncbi:NAD-dependent epimerase/dehydratase family protein [Hydrogenophaga pseudoflava]|uniref:NAD-dependent epimerase/dehydratase family protein n=1 Tax=Hydrogenophaga pseudoflava TaxID=47421 RepID=UPI0008247588|nr:NAD-dependent epimerase/dehydratase family protein [Hydrogenophaga pseudoflava]
MHVLITGAAGFLGRALAQRLVPGSLLGGRTVTRLTLLDLALDGPAPEGVRYVEGDMGDADWLRGALEKEPPIDALFQLASIPGGTAEQDYPLSRRVNLDATQTLLEQGRQQVAAGHAAPVFVFASSIAVFGHLPALVDDDAPTRPQMTYGTQKRIGELWVEDFSRRCWVDGRAVRIPGVLARPPARTGQLSAFLSDLIRELAAGRAFTCPTTPGATTWASSLPCVVRQLLHAAMFDVATSGGHRVLTLPTLRFAMDDLVRAVGRVHDTPAADLVRWAPDERIEALFGRFPPLVTPRAEAAGFRADADLEALVRQALAPG